MLEDFTSGHNVEWQTGRSMTEQALWIYRHVAVDLTRVRFKQTVAAVEEEMRHFA